MTLEEAQEMADKICKDKNNPGFHLLVAKELSEMYNKGTTNGRRLMFCWMGITIFLFLSLKNLGII